MSNPSLARSKKGRVYVWPPTEPHELEVPSTTTIISGGVPKPFLKWWAAKVVAEYAYDHVDSWKGLPKDDAVDLLKRAHVRYTNKKADRGTAVHAAVEDFLGDDPDTDDLSPAGRALYRGALKFLQDFQPRFDQRHIEATVFSRTHQYAGTADLFAQVGDKTAVIDWKTSKDIYPETALQLASYAHGDFIGFADGSTLDVPDVDLGIGVRLICEETDDGWVGDYEAVGLDVGDRVFQGFLAAQGVFEWSKVTSKNVRDRDVQPAQFDLEAAA